MLDIDDLYGGTDDANTKVTVKEIKIINPEPESQFADILGLSGSLEFGELIKLTGTGTVSVYSGSNTSSSYLIDQSCLTIIDGARDNINSVLQIDGVPLRDVKQANDPGENWFKPKTTYHIAISPKTIEYLQENETSFSPRIYFAGIDSSSTAWRYRTAPLSYSGLQNPFGVEIPNQYYRKYSKKTPSDAH